MTTLPDSLVVEADQWKTDPEGTQFHWTSVIIDHSTTHSVARRSEILPDGAPVLIEYEHGRAGDSWIYYITQRSAMRSERFRTTGRMAIESLFSPIALVRSFDARGAKDMGEKANAAGRTVRTFRLNDGHGREELDLDTSTGQLIAYRALLPNGEIAVTLEFGDWRPVPGTDGTSFPWKIDAQQLLEPGRLEWSGFQVRSVSKPTGGPPDRMKVPIGFTVNDWVDGTTKNWDGKVIGQLTPPDAGTRDHSLLVRVSLAFAAVVVVFLAARAWHTRKTSPL